MGIWGFGDLRIFGPRVEALAQTPNLDVTLNLTLKTLKLTLKTLKLTLTTLNLTLTTLNLTLKLTLNLTLKLSFNSQKSVKNN